jgi:hypothetical protein
MEREEESEFHVWARSLLLINLLKRRLNKLYSQQEAKMGFSAVRKSVCLLMLDFFAVRTINQITILNCLRTGKGQICIEPCFTLPAPMSQNAMSQTTADMIFDTIGSVAITITDRGQWTRYDLSMRAGRATESSSGRIDFSLTEKKDLRAGWWKMEWIDYTEEVLIAASNGLYLLDVAVIFLYPRC